MTVLRVTRAIGAVHYRLHPPPPGHRHLLARVSNRADPRRPGVMEYRCPCGYSTHV